MNATNKRIIRLVLNAFLIVLITSGIISQTLSGLLVSRGPISFLYFTTQSNLIVALLALFLIFYDIKEKARPKAVQIIHHIAVVATTLTFLVFSLMLGPYIEKANYFYSLQNIALHNLGPIIALIVYLLYDDDLSPNVRLLALISPFSYMIVIYLLYFSGVRFTPYELPYFFLEYMTYGWLRIDYPNFGVLYWWILILLLIVGISYVLYYLREKARQNHVVIYICGALLLCFALMFISINTIMKL